MSGVVVVAGENSGDLHGAELASALFSRRPGIEVFGAGGSKMREAGVDVVVDLTPHAAMGAVEVLGGLRRFVVAYDKMKRVVRERRPEAVVLIDFPEFNLRFGSYAKRLGVPVVYYISPQVWAWRGGRVRKIAKIVDKMLVIFDFEEELYREAGVDVTFVGHPLLDVVESREADPAFKEKLGLEAGDSLVGILPGSRRKEVERLLPIMLEAAERIREERPGVKFAVSCAAGVDCREVERACGASRLRPPIVEGDTYELVRQSELILVASGTATLEAAILGTPMVVVYRVSPITCFLFSRLMNISDYALVNIVAGRRVVPELIQAEARPELIAAEGMRLFEPAVQEGMRGELAEVRRKLGGPGASERAAEAVLSVMAKAGGRVSGGVSSSTG